MGDRSVRSEDLYDAENDPEIEAAYEDGIESAESYVRGLAKSKKYNLRRERIERNVYKFFDSYFDNSDLSELLDFVDREIDDVGYRNSCWLLSEAIAYNQLNQNYTENKFDNRVRKIRDIMKDYIENISNYDKKSNNDLSLTNKNIKKIYPNSPINRDGTSSTIGSMTPSSYFMSEFLEIGEDIFNEDTHKRNINEMVEQLTLNKLFKTLLSPVLFLYGGMGTLHPELYHTLNLAQKYEQIDTINGKNVANCFYVRSIELIEKYSNVYEEKGNEECKEQLGGLMELLRDSRENASI